MIKAVAYCGVSTLEQAKEGRSLELQEKVIREYCIDHDIELVKVFVEAASGISGYV